MDLIIEFFKSNQILLAGVGLSGMTIITLWLRKVPFVIYAFLKRELTTTVIITSQNTIFHNLMKYIDTNYTNTNFRTYKISNGAWGDNRVATTGVGYGIHHIFYKRRLLMLSLSKESGNQSQYDKDTLKITKFGRSKKLITEFTESVQDMVKKKTKTELFKLDVAHWDFIRTNVIKSSLDNIFIPSSDKELLLTTINNFISSEKFYIDNGIPYQLGILLYGPPGTGKTSLIKAISSYLTYDIYYVSPSNLRSLESGMMKMPNKVLMVIEDIDAATVTHSRAKSNNKQIMPSSSLKGSRDFNNDDNDDSYLDDILKSSFSDILNAMDGLFASHGRILIATTNHIAKLDVALLRPGRIDLKLEIDYVQKEVLQKYLLKFYKADNDIIEDDAWKIKDGISMAEIQNMVLEKKSAFDIIKIVSI